MTARRSFYFFLSFSPPIFLLYFFYPFPYISVLIHANCQYSAIFLRSWLGIFHKIHPTLKKNIYFTNCDLQNSLTSSLWAGDWPPSTVHIVCKVKIYLSPQDFALSTKKTTTRPSQICSPGLAASRLLPWELPRPHQIFSSKMFVSSKILFLVHTFLTVVTH